MTARGSRRKLQSPKVWTPDAVRALGVRMDAKTYFDVIGTSERTGYDLIRQGRTPTPALRLGNKYVFAVQPVLEWLGIPVDDPDDPPAPQSLRPSLRAVPDPPEAA